MLEQYESPVKKRVDVKLQLTPEEKLHFREAQESDPKFLDANRKLEESLLKCNGTRFRFTIPQNRGSNPAIDSSAVSDSSNKKNSEVNASVVNLNSSHDIFDEMVSATSYSPANKKDESFEDGKMTKSPNDSSRLSINVIDNSVEEPTITKTPSSTKYSSVTSAKQSSSTTKDSSLFGFSKIKANNEINIAAATKPSASGKKTGRFVFRTATASKAANTNTEINDDPERNKLSSSTTASKVANGNTEIKNVDPERKKPSSPISKSKKKDDDKFDVDTVLRELSYENHLPVGANRTRPNSPLKNTHELPKKPVKRSGVQLKEIEINDNSSSSSNIQRRLSTFSSTNISSLTSTSTCSNSTVTNTADMACNGPPPKTGFENLQNVLNRISNSSALKTTSNVSSICSLISFHFLHFNFVADSRVVPH